MKHNKIMARVQTFNICAFCEKPMGTGDGRKQSKEHVLGDKRIERLGLSEYKMHQKLHRGTWQMVADKPKAKNFWHKGVCTDCNNVWMSRLEVEADPIIVGLVRHELAPYDLTEGQRETLSRWVLKTCGAAFLSRHLETKSFPVSHYNLAFRQVWPEGAVAFVCYMRPGSKNVIPAISGFAQRYGVGPVDGSSNANEDKAGKFYTFIAGYGDVGIGIAYANPRLGSAVLLKDIHHPFWVSRTAPGRISPDLRPIHMFDDPQPIGHNSLNTILHSVGITSDPPDIPFPQLPFPGQPFFHDNPEMRLEENNQWFWHLLELKVIGKTLGNISEEEFTRRLTDEAASVYRRSPPLPFLMPLQTQQIGL
jgi:hypothetical protein